MPLTRRAREGFSVIRVMWAFCLLACAGVIGTAIWLRHQHLAWHDRVTSSRSAYAQWTAAAQRDARALLGDVEGLTRDEAEQRLQATLGADQPFPEPPMPPGTALAGMPWDPDPLREPPVVWNVRSKNLRYIITMYGGRADALDVDMMNRSFSEPQRPPRLTMIWFNALVTYYVVVTVALMAGVLLWAARRSHRAASHAILMAALLASVIVLCEYWGGGLGTTWRPLILGGTSIDDVPWKGPALAVIVGLLAFHIPSRLRPRPGVCATCGYNLTGNTSGVCPECGTAITPPLARSAIGFTPSTPPSPSRG